MENKFKLGQKVRYKDMPEGYAFTIARISLLGDSIYYAYDNTHVGVKESDLELVKEKKKASLFAPIIQYEKGYYIDHHHHSDKSIFATQLNVVGFHEIVVEVDDE